MSAPAFLRAWESPFFREYINEHCAGHSLGTLHIFLVTHLIITTTQLNSYIIITPPPHITEGETEAQRGTVPEVTQPGKGRAGIGSQAVCLQSPHSRPQVCCLLGGTPVFRAWLRNKVVYELAIAAEQATLKCAAYFSQFHLLSEQNGAGFSWAFCLGCLRLEGQQEDRQPGRPTP